jgi:hypothetical protein
MNIYIACGLTHVPRDVFPSYVAFIHNLAGALATIHDVVSVKYALVDSDPQLSTVPQADRPALCYAWDRRMVEQANLIIADASFPSTGLGIELQIAEAATKPVILLVGDYTKNRVASAHYTNPDQTEHELQIGSGIVSLMAIGLPAIIQIIPYSDLTEAVRLAILSVNIHISKEADRLL